MSRTRSHLSASLLLAPLLLSAAFTAQAYQAGDVIVRAGAITVDPREESDAIKHAALGSVSGSKATLDSDTQLGLNLLYMLSPQIGVELLAATPFSHNVGVKGMPGGFSGLNGELGEIKHLPPTLSAVWYPVNSESVFQPYFGAGINYTWFFDESLSSEAKGKGFQGLDLDNSWGLSLQAGADMMLTEKLILNAQVRYIDISTTGHTRLAGDKVQVDVDVDPMVYMVSLGYKF